MARYIFHRCLGALAVMWAVATLVFFMLRLVPGDPIAAMLADVGGAEEIAALRAKLGLDQPLYVQYGKWFWNVLQGDMSIVGPRPPQLATRAMATIAGVPRPLGTNELMEQPLVGVGRGECTSTYARCREG